MSHRTPSRPMARHKQSAPLVPGRPGLAPLGQRQAPAEAPQAKARALPAPSLWIADLLILGLALGVLGNLW